MSKINQKNEAGLAHGYWDGCTEFEYLKGEVVRGTIYNGYVRPLGRFTSYPHGYYVKNGDDWGYEYVLENDDIVAYIYLH